MATETTTKISPNETLLRHIEELRDEIKRYREQHGDPAEGFREFMRATFDPDALEQTYREYRRDKGLDLDGDVEADH